MTTFNENISTNRILRLISDTDCEQWIVLVDREARTLDMLPVINTGNAGKQVVLWEKKQPVTAASLGS